MSEAEWGLVGTVVILVIKIIRDELRQWQSHRWAKEGVDQDRLFDTIRQLFGTQKDSLVVMDRTADALDDMRAEMSQITAALRDLTAQIARRE